MPTSALVSGRFTGPEALNWGHWSFTQEGLLEPHLIWLHGFPKGEVTPKFASSDKEGGPKHLLKNPSQGGNGSLRIPGCGSLWSKLGVHRPENVVPHHALLLTLRARGPERLS